VHASLYALLQRKARAAPEAQARPQAGVNMAQAQFLSAASPRAPSPRNT
jgi:hypothetical protein